MLATLQVELAVAPERVPDRGARAALEKPLMRVEVHHRGALRISVAPAGLLFADVFPPNFLVLFHVAREQVHAFSRVQINDLDAILTQPIDSAAKVLRLA